MEVTRSNFQEVLTELDGILKNATFLGIDGEFTGLNSGPDAGAFDTPAQYYTKLRAGSMDFLLVQFGLSVFTFDTQTQKYSQRSYNFYVFPRPLNRAAPDSRFMCQASCISFLATQGFDFNKLFNLGIPYLTTIEEEKLVKRLEERQKARDEVQELIPISDDDRPQIEEICTRIDEFIASDAEELTIDKCNAFIRRLVHQEVRVRWPNKLRVEGKSDCSGPSLVVQRSGTKEEEEQKEVERREREKLEIKQAVGLSLLLRKIADSGKLIVGHNMLLDLCHIIHKFFGPLPESYLEFKSLVHGLFPRILDTKVICQSQQFRENVPSSNLNVLLERVSKSPFKIPEVEFVDGKSYSTLAEKSHEAGYDAYITGICFIALCNYLGSLQKPEIPVVLSDSHLLNPFLNKLLIARLKDYPYITLDGNDPNPSRDHVFHLTFPKDWKHSDISQLFSPFGSVYISWLSDTSAYVALNRREQAAGVIKSLWRGTTYRIQKYAKYQASLETNVNTGERKRKLSSSEPAATKKEENSEPTNGVKTTQGDDGWEVATGNELKLSSEPITPCPYPHERSRATSKTRGSNHEVVESLFEQIKVAQKVRLKSTLSLPTDLRNGKKKNTVPKYTILRRDTEAELNSEVEVKDVLRRAEIQLSSMVSVANTNVSTRVSQNGCKAKVEKSKKHSSAKGVTSAAPCFGKSIQTDSCVERSAQANVCGSARQKQVEVLTAVSYSPKKTVKAPSVSSSPSASPGVRRNAKKLAKLKQTDGTTDKQEKISCSRIALLPSQEKSCSNGEKMKHSLDHERNDKAECVASVQRSDFPEKENVSGLIREKTKRSCSIMLMAKIVGLLFLYYIIFIETHWK